MNVVVEIVFSYDYYMFFYNNDDSFFYRFDKRKNEWLVEKYKIWRISAQKMHEYEIPENEIVHTQYGTFADMCEYYKEKIIFSKL